MLGILFSFTTLFQLLRRQSAQVLNNMETIKYLCRNKQIKPLCRSHLRQQIFWNGLHLNVRHRGQEDFQLLFN